MPAIPRQRCGPRGLDPSQLRRHQAVSGIAEFFAIAAKKVCSSRIYIGQAKQKPVFGRIKEPRTNFRFLAMNHNSILLVEDDPRLAQSLSQGLSEADFKVSHAKNGEDGYFLYSQEQPDLILLDLNLPGRDGLSILKAIRKENPDVRVLIISARDTVEDRVQGLEIGADDYLIKPFAFSELLARIRVLLRRKVSENEFEWTLADLRLEIMDRKVFRGEREIVLTPREFEILAILMRNHGRAVSRKTIAHDVWKVARATPLDNVIDVHVMHLRKKIDTENVLPLIHTIRGVGFMLHDSPDPS